MIVFNDGVPKPLRQGAGLFPSEPVHPGGPHAQREGALDKFYILLIRKKQKN